MSVCVYVCGSRKREIKIKNKLTIFSDHLISLQMFFFILFHDDDFVFFHYHFCYILGPDFWGRLNPKWSHCSKGRRQSPIDIDTELLIYDQYLRELYIKGDYIDGNLINTGRSIEIEVDQKKPIIITGGPLSYQYTLSNVTLHFGRENNRGSEHSINQLQFSGELQFYGYNGQLYSNWSEAKRSPNGLVAIATMIKMTKNMSTNAQLKIMINSFKNISNRGM